jgi:hypothetical protein
MNQIIQAIKETAQYLGGKIDTLAATSRAPVKIDIGDMAKKLGEVATAVSVAAKVLESGAKVHELKKVEAGIHALAQSVAGMAKSIGGVKPTDLSETNRLLADMIRAVARIKLDVPKTDVSRLDDVAALLVDLRTAIMELPAPIDRTDEVVKAIKGIKVQIPESMKLDAASLATVRYGGGGGATGGYASEANSANLSMPLANTQYSHRFSPNTIGFRIKLRSKDTELLYSWQAGTLPTSGTGAAYSTVQEFGDIVRDNIDVGNKLIYLQTAGTDQVAEIEEFILA